MDIDELLREKHELQFKVAMLERELAEHRMINKAAPDLLSALQVFVDKYDAAVDEEKFGIGLVNIDFIKARAAVNKAIHGDDGRGE